MSATRRALPVLRPLRPAQLAWFDLTTTSRIALATLRESLGAPEARRAVRAILVRAVSADPTAGLPPVRTTDERLTRTQLRSVLLLEDALRLDLGLSEADTAGVVRAVVRASGTAFLLRFFAGFGPEDWRLASDAEREAFAHGVASRIFNADVDAPRATPESLAFDVTHCRFVTWLSALDRLHLAPLFCEVDAALVERDDVPMTLDRPTTLASGGDRCRFRFAHGT